MIIQYDQNPSLNVDQKLLSLTENIQLALNEEMNNVQLALNEQSEKLVGLFEIDPKVIELYRDLGWE